MMMRKSTVAALSILVAVATAHPYAEWNNARYRWNDLFAARDDEIGARIRSQTTVEPSSCANITYKESKNEKSHRVRVCSADPEDSPNKVCLDTRVNPCCSIPLLPDRSRNTLVSSANASVNGENVTVEFYLTKEPTVGICFRLDNAHQRAKTCSQPRYLDGPCLPPCTVANPNDTFCFNNTPTRNSSSCDSDGCQCLEDYLEPDCCEQVCRNNCRTGLPNGNCSTCFNGYKPPTCCELESGCNKPQKLFFYIDATASNTFENFCPLMVIMQMLVAAFNSSSTSGTQIASLLFSDNAKNKTPSYVFDIDTPCSDAVQGSGKSLSSLMIDFGACLDNNRSYDSSLFPSSCGEGTSAVKGLQEILRLASISTRSSAEGAIVMLTDGIITDNASERSKVLSDLKSAGISTLIVAGIRTSQEDEADLTKYTSSDNILVGTDPVQLGIDIVNKMQERDIICQDHADNIIRILNDDRGGNLINLFCRCHRKGFNLMTRPICQRKYPTCGGPLSFGLPNLPPGRASQALEYMNRLLIEEEILAAVEKVLEQRHG